MNALPPVPAVFGPGWREEWRARIAEHEPWLMNWFEHQRDDAYWRHGSVRPAYDRIEIPDDDRRRMGGRLPQQHVPHDGAARRERRAAPAARRAVVARRDVVVAARPAHRPRARDGRAGGTAGSAASTTASTPSPRPSGTSASLTAPEPDLDAVAGRVAGRLVAVAAVVVVEVTLGARAPYAVKPDVGTAAWISCAGHLPYGQQPRPAARRRRLAHVGRRPVVPRCRGPGDRGQRAGGCSR